MASGAVHAQQPSDSLETEKKVSVVALPLLFFTPETSLGFGAAGVLNIKGSDSTIQTSQLLFGGAYTLFNQVLTYANYNLYLDKERYWLKGEIGYYKYFFYYYGIGPDTRLSDEETYEVAFPRFRTDALGRVGKNSYFGVRYWLENHRMLVLDSAGLLDSNRPLGWDGGTISGLGSVYILDTRDNVYSASSGYKIELSAMGFHEAIGSEFRYLQANTDFSVFFTPWKKYRHVFGAQVQSETLFGDVPFFALSRLGSARMMRGYYSGRFLDQKQMAAQMEYRFPLFWRLEQTLFASTAFIGNDFDDWALSKAKTAIGSGLRLVLNKNDRIKVRLDVAYGEELNFYVTFNEAF